MIRIDRTPEKQFQITARASDGEEIQVLRIPLAMLKELIECAHSIEERPYLTAVESSAYSPWVAKWEIDRK